MFGNPFFPEGHHGMGPPRPFRTQYRCYSVSMMPGTTTICMITCQMFSTRFLSLPEFILILIIIKLIKGNERESLEQGGKIILPPSALDQLTRLNIVYPMLFKLTNASVSLHIYSIICRQHWRP